MMVKLSVLRANRRMGTKAEWLDSLLKGLVKLPIINLCHLVTVTSHSWEKNKKDQCHPKIFLPT